MADVTVKVTGSAELVKGLQALGGKRLRKVTRKVMTDVGKSALGKANRAVTGKVLERRSGRLARSIAIDVKDLSVGVLAGKGASSGVVWEWRDKNGPRRFLRPSMEAASQGLERKLILEWEKEIFRGIKSG